VEMGGVVDLMLAYAERKPISFPTLEDKGIVSDGRRATLAGSHSSLFCFKCPHPLDACVSRWTIVMAPIAGESRPGDVGIGLAGSATTLPSQGDWYELLCRASMYVNDHTFYGPRASLQYRPAPPLDGGTQHFPPITLPHIKVPSGTSGFGVSLFTDSLPTATVRVSVDLETEIVTWTLSNDQPLTLRVPGLRKKHAYVDLSPCPSATIIQHHDPWLF
jgi:hypothetical protein